MNTGSSDHVLWFLGDVLISVFMSLAPSLGSANERCVQLSEELTKRLKELQQMEEQHCQSKAEMKKVRALQSQKFPTLFITPLSSCGGVSSVSKVKKGLKAQNFVG